MDFSSGSLNKTRETLETIDDYSQRKLGDYAIIKKVGEGNLSTVYKCQHVDTGKVFAIKVIECEDLEDD